MPVARSTILAWIGIVIILHVCWEKAAFLGRIETPNAIKRTLAITFLCEGVAGLTVATLSFGVWPQCIAKRINPIRILCSAKVGINVLRWWVFT